MVIILKVIQEANRVMSKPVFTNEEWQAIKSVVDYNIRTHPTPQYGVWYYYWRSLLKKIKEQGLTPNDLAIIHNTRLFMGISFKPWTGKKGIYKKISSYLESLGNKTNFRGEFGWNIPVVEVNDK